MKKKILILATLLVMVLSACGSDASRISCDTFSIDPGEKWKEFSSYALNTQSNSKLDSDVLQLVPAGQSTGNTDGIPYIQITVQKKGGDGTRKELISGDFDVTINKIKFTGMNLTLGNHADFMMTGTSGKYLIYVTGYRAGGAYSLTDSSVAELFKTIKIK